MNLDTLNTLSEAEFREALHKCCGALRWVAGMWAGRPFPDAATLHEQADAVWGQMGEADWLEAFAAHPRIGASKPPEVAQNTASWTSREQSGMQSADEILKAEMATKNAEYEQRFGFIYIVCASGKSAPELLEILSRRLNSNRQSELQTAAQEQIRITHLRLDKLLQD